MLQSWACFKTFYKEITTKLSPDFIYERVHYFSGKSMSLVRQKIRPSLLKCCKIIATWLKISYWVSGSCLFFF